MLSIIIAESSLELVPKELYSHNSIVTYCKKMSKHPSQVLLDNSWHFAAMKGIKNEIKRGRPDIVHFCLLEACTIPLYVQDKLAVYIHTLDDMVIVIGTRVRLPKSYHRFAGLIEKLYSEKIIKDGTKKLLELKKMTFSELIDKIKPDKVIGLSTEGTQTSYSDIANIVSSRSCLVVGGFPKGHFSDSVKKRIDSLVQVDKESLEAHVVVARILYECEKTIFM
jgi:rRNA small subunit pseudouridine methyltransferase Nep1